MELGKKIQQILQNNPGVYVAGLGVFNRIHLPSTYDEKREVFLPPIDYVEFDAAASNGVNLTNYIHQESNISVSEAEQVVRQAVEELKNEIADKGEVLVKQLGTLVQYGDGLVFKAIDLSSFRLDPISRVISNPYNKVDDEILSDVSPENTLANIEISESNMEEPEPTGVFNAEEKVEDMEPIIVPDEAVPVQEYEPIYEVEEKTSGSNTRWYILVAIIALGIAGTLWYLNKSSSRQDTDIPKNEEQPVVTTDSLDKLQHTSVTDSLDSTGVDNLVVDTLANHAPTSHVEQTVSYRQEDVIPGNHGWYIVIGSRIPLDDAKEMVEKYKKQGHSKVRLIQTRSGLATVIWDSYANKTESDSALRYVIKNHVADAWPSQVKR